MEYEGLDTICFKCGRYGHKQEECSLNFVPEESGMQEDPVVRNSSETSEQQPEKHPLLSVPGVKSEEAYGSWMQAKSKVRQKYQRMDSVKKLQQKEKMERGPGMTHKSIGTRFDVLMEEDRPVNPTASETQNKNKLPAKEWRRRKGTQSTLVKEREKSAAFNEAQGSLNLERSEQGTFSHREDSWTFMAKKEEAAPMRERKGRKARTSKSYGL